MKGMLSTLVFFALFALAFGQSNGVNQITIAKTQTVATPVVVEATPVVVEATPVVVEATPVVVEATPVVVQAVATTVVTSPIVTQVYAVASATPQQIVTVTTSGASSLSPFWMF